MKWEEKKKRNKLRIILFEKLILPFNRFRSLFGVKIENKIPRIIIHEKFKNVVKWSSRGLIAIGILSSLFSIPVWYVSLGFALFLFYLQWSLEKIIFRFTTIFITPLPDFKWNSKEWDGMGYMYTPDVKLPSFFGPAFVSKDFGVKVFNLLLAWNYKSHDDIRSNICISFIEEDNGSSYRVYLYPNMNRKSVVEFENKIKSLENNRGKDHHQLIVQMILCQLFPLHANSNYHKWKELFLAGQPTCLGVFTYDRTSEAINPVEEILPIRVYKIDFKKRSELKKDDIEYMHGKYTIGL